MDDQEFIQKEAANFPKGNEKEFTKKNKDRHNLKAQMAKLIAKAHRSEQAHDEKEQQHMENRIKYMEKKGILPEHVRNNKRQTAKYEHVYLS